MCSRHMTGDESKFSTVKKYTGGKVKFGGNSFARLFNTIRTVVHQQGRTKWSGGGLLYGGEAER